MQKPSSFCFRQLADEGQSGQGLYRPLGCRKGIVPDNKSRNIPEVVLVRRWAVGVLGIWRGRDSWVKGGASGVSLQATWDRGGRFLSQLGGCQISRRGYKGETKGSQQGERKSKGNCAMYIYNCVVCAMEWLDVWMMLVIVYIIIIIGMNVVNNLNSV